MDSIDFERILSGERTSRSDSGVNYNDFRDCFENDYDRLIHSFHVRRLQDKTQVVPLIKSDFIRTRLTHSHEVAAIGKSMGKAIGLALYNNDLEKAFKFAHLIEAACLIHDLGNPPFGHHGETAINKSTSDLISKFSSEFEDIPEKLLLELKLFDGNAQNVRIAQNLHIHKLDIDKRGYNLTFSTLLTLIKYPLSCNDKLDDSPFGKKYGFFYDEIELIKKGRKILGIQENKRHPCAYILEAADDIAYSAADLEDGIRMNLVSFIDLKNIFSSIFHDFSDIKDHFDRYDNYIQNFGSDGINIWAGEFRVITQRKMIQECIKEFIDRKEEIFKGEMANELLSYTNSMKIRRSFKLLQSKVFNHKPIIQSELKGERAIRFFFELFGKALFEGVDKDLNKELERLGKNREYKILSSTHRLVFEEVAKRNPHLLSYYKVRLIQDYLSGMTDTFCDNLYESLC